MHLLIVNGPNLNLIGKRETQIYGNDSFNDYFAKLSDELDIKLQVFQSNIEGEIIDCLQRATCDGIVLNAGGYTHTSVAIRDCVSAIDIPVVEVHISNILAREDFRHISLISPVCQGSIFGFGLESYRLATLYFLTNKR
jgi:3-dehydroquinate dehydratase-2